jgi:hypothetical protein
MKRAAIPAALLRLLGLAFTASWSLSKETANPMKVTNMVPDEIMNMTRLRNRPTKIAAVVEMINPRILQARISLSLNHPVV